LPGFAPIALASPVVADKNLVNVRSGAIHPPLPPIRTGLFAASAKSRSPVSLILLAVVLGYAVKNWGPPWVQPVFRALNFGSLRELAAFVAAFVAAIALHEAGHLLAALCFHYQVLGGALGPFRFSVLHGRWAVRFSGRNLFSASISAIPVKTDSWRNSMLAVVAAGPLATLITALAALLFVLQSPSGTIAYCFFAALAQIDFFIFVLGLLPNGPAAAVRNDASLFWALLHDTAEAENILLYHVVTQLRVTGFRPCYYHQPVIQKIAMVQGRPDMCALFARTISLWALDRGDLQSADAWDTRAVELGAMCDIRIQHHALADSACLDLLIRNDVKSAKNKCSEIDFALLSPEPFMHRARAVREISYGNIHEGIAEICRAEYSFPNRLPVYDFEQELLTQLRDVARCMSEQEVPVFPANAEISSDKKGLDAAAAL
jgi:hypothetical protein